MFPYEPALNDINIHKMDYLWGLVDGNYTLQGLVYRLIEESMELIERGGGVSDPFDAVAATMIEVEKKCTHIKFLNAMKKATIDLLKKLPSHDYSMKELDYILSRKIRAWNKQDVNLGLEIAKKIENKYL